MYILYILRNVHPPRSAGGVEPSNKSSGGVGVGGGGEGKVDRISIFRGGLLGNRG